MKKIQIFSYELGFGGIEREVITLANSLVDLYDIELIFAYSCNNTYQINKKIQVTILFDKKEKIKTLNNLKIDANISKVLDIQADIIVSTDMLFNSKITKIFSGKKIFWDHKDLADNNKFMKNLKNLGLFDTLVVSNKEDEKKCIVNNLNAVFIPNFIETIPQVSSNLNILNIISVGKLRDDKCFDTLLEVIKIVNDQNKLINLHIVGDGEERMRLENIVKAKNLNSVVHFYGSLDKEEIGNKMLESSLFVTCTSKESFGISIIEAMSYGLPVLAFDDVDCLKSIVKNDINGFLIEDRSVTKMAEKILELFNDFELLKNLGSCAKESVLVYDINSVKGDWIKLF